MTTTHGYVSMELSDALYTLATAAERINATMLDELVRRYPQYAEALTDMAIDLAVEALDDDDDSVVMDSNTSPAVSRALSSFSNRLYEISTSKIVPQSKAAGSVENPFSTLDRAGLHEFARELDASTLFVMKLRDRLVDTETISPGFISMVAEKRKVPLEVMLAHFAAPPGMQMRAHYKSDQKPEAVRQQSFDEAVRTSNLTVEQQKYLLGL